MPDTTPFVRFSAGVETESADEQRYLEEIVATQRAIGERLAEKYRHGVRSVHSKSHAVLAGTVEVLSGVAEPYAQGLFAKPGRYDAVIRLSTNPGDILPDSISTPRGFALKVLGPEGEAMVGGHEGERTQDLLLINGPVLGAPGPKEFAGQMKLFLQHLDDPQELKEAVSAGARVAEQISEIFGKPNPQFNSLGGHAPTNFLGETFNTQLAARHGDYIAKYALTPVSENLRALTGTKIDIKNPNAIRDSLAAFFEHEGGVWDLGVQLCTNLERMPIEDGATPWPEDESPFVTVARLTIAAQPTYTPERRVYADDILTFSPWHALEAHRPLGAHNRVRRAAYAMSSGLRHDENVRAKREPKSGTEFFVIDREAAVR